MSSRGTLFQYFERKEPTTVKTPFDNAGDSDGVPVDEVEGGARKPQTSSEKENIPARKDKKVSQSKKSGTLKNGDAEVLREDDSVAVPSKPSKRRKQEDVPIESPHSKQTSEGKNPFQILMDSSKKKGVWEKPMKTEDNTTDSSDEDSSCKEVPVKDKNPAASNKFFAIFTMKRSPSGPSGTGKEKKAGATEKSKEQRGSQRQGKEKLNGADSSTVARSTSTKRKKAVADVIEETTKPSKKRSKKEKSAESADDVAATPLTKIPSRRAKKFRVISDSSDFESDEVQKPAVRRLITPKFSSKKERKSRSPQPKGTPTKKPASSTLSTAQKLLKKSRQIKVKPTDPHCNTDIDTCSDSEAKNSEASARFTRNRKRGPVPSLTVSNNSPSRRTPPRRPSIAASTPAVSEDITPQRRSSRVSAQPDRFMHSCSDVELTPGKKKQQHSVGDDDSEGTRKLVKLGTKSKGKHAKLSLHSSEKVKNRSKDIMTKTKLLKSSKRICGASKTSNNRLTTEDEEAVVARRTSGRVRRTRVSVENDGEHDSDIVEVAPSKPAKPRKRRRRKSSSSSSSSSEVVVVKQKISKPGVDAFSLLKRAARPPPPPPPPQESPGKIAARKAFLGSGVPQQLVTQAEATRELEASLMPLFPVISHVTQRNINSAGHVTESDLDPNTLSPLLTAREALSTGLRWCEESVMGPCQTPKITTGLLRKEGAGEASESAGVFVKFEAFHGEMSKGDGEDVISNEGTIENDKVDSREGESSGPDQGGVDGSGDNAKTDDTTTEKRLDATNLDRTTEGSNATNPDHTTSNLARQVLTTDPETPARRPVWSGSSTYDVSLDLNLPSILPLLHHLISSRDSTNSTYPSSSQPEDDDIAIGDNTSPRVSMWTELYRPSAPEGLIPASTALAAADLYSWLEGWQPPTAPWDENSDEVVVDSTVLLVGPSGCGKTCAVYAAAARLGMQVLEVSSSCRRSGRHLSSRLAEATQSHKVALHGGSITNTGEACDVTQSIILLEDIQLVSDELDDGFLAAVASLAASAKRPVVLTSDDASVTKTKLLRSIPHQLIEVTAPCKEELVLHLKLVALVEGYAPEGGVVEGVVEEVGCDVRKSLLQLQFMCEGLSRVAEVETRTVLEHFERCAAEATGSGGGIDDGDVSGKKKTDRRKLAAKNCISDDSDDEGMKKPLNRKASLEEVLAILPRSLAVLPALSTNHQMPPEEPTLLHCPTVYLPRRQSRWLPPLTVRKVPLCDGKRRKRWRVIDTDLLSDDEDFVDNSKQTVSSACAGEVKDPPQAVKRPAEEAALLADSVNAMAVLCDNRSFADAFVMTHGTDDVILSDDVTSPLWWHRQAAPDMSESEQTVCASTECAVSVAEETMRTIQRAASRKCSDRVELAMSRFRECQGDETSHPPDGMTLPVYFEQGKVKTEAWLDNSRMTVAVPSLLLSRRTLCADVLPSIRGICRLECVRRSLDGGRTRRFLHYLDQMGLHAIPLDLRDRICTSLT